MTRRRERISVSMFPFLSVLCTVIGVMVLFIVLILSTRVVETDPKYRRASTARDLPVPGKPENIVDGIPPKSFDELQDELKRMIEAMQERAREVETLQRKLAALEDLLEFKKTELFVPVTSPIPMGLNPPNPVAMVPAEGFEVPLNPVFVEVSSDGYTVHPRKAKYPAITRNETGDDVVTNVASDLKAFLHEADRKRRKEYLLFLIHPNGVDAFDNMRYYLVTNYERIEMGWEPFSTNWIVAADTLGTH